MAVAKIHAGKQVKCRCQQQVNVPLVAQLATNQKTAPPSGQNPSGQNSQPTPKPAPAPTPAVNPADFMTFVCSGCNSTLKVKKSDAGKSCRCRCGTSSTIPVPKLAPVALEPLFPEPVNKDFDFDFGGSTGTGNLGPPMHQPVVGNPYQTQGIPFSATVSGQSSGPRNLPQRTETRSAQESQSWEGRVFNGSVLGGVAAMVIAIVWFFAGLAGGVIFFYPPILFIIGLVGMIRGLVAGQ
ncbi:MAG: hypothetical protein ABL888_11460 [Pirellulaceae bacterium]